MAKTNAARRRAFEKKRALLRDRLDPKKRGELSELAFVYKAASLGFAVAKPYGDSDRFDFIVHSRRHFWRVQVRSTSSLQYGAYHVAVAKPYGDSEPYDFIVYSGPHFRKVQVKSTSNLVHGGYPLNSRRKRKGQRVPYTAHEIDFLVAYVSPENAWFVIPIQALLSHPSIRLYPRRSPRQGHFDQYRDAWWLVERRD